MDSNTADHLSNEFTFRLSALIPEITQVLQQYQVSGILKTELKTLSSGCTYHGGIPSCTSYEPVLQFVPELLSFKEVSESSSGIEQRFRIQIASKLFESITFLSQSIQQTGESFEVDFIIDLATVNPAQPVVCQWISSDILKCSQP